MTRCPYCGDVHISKAKACVTFGAEELFALGLSVPQIRQCQACKATFSPEEVAVGSAAYKAARARVSQ